MKSLADNTSFITDVHRDVKETHENHDNHTSYTKKEPQQTRAIHLFYFGSIRRTIKMIRHAFILNLDNAR